MSAFSKKHSPSARADVRERGGRRRRPPLSRTSLRLLTSRTLLLAGSTPVLLFAGVTVLPVVVGQTTVGPATTGSTLCPCLSQTQLQAKVPSGYFTGVFTRRLVEEHGSFQAGPPPQDVAPDHSPSELWFLPHLLPGSARPLIDRAEEQRLAARLVFEYGVPIARGGQEANPALAAAARRGLETNTTSSTSSTSTSSTSSPVPTSTSSTTTTAPPSGGNTTAPPPLASAATVVLVSSYTAQEDLPATVTATQLEADSGYKLAKAQGLAVALSTASAVILSTQITITSFQFVVRVLREGRDLTARSVKTSFQISVNQVGSVSSSGGPRDLCPPRGRIGEQVQLSDPSTGTAVL